MAVVCYLKKNVDVRNIKLAQNVTSHTVADTHTLRSLRCCFDDTNSKNEQVGINQDTPCFIVVAIEAYFGQDLEVEVILRLLG